MQPTSPARKNTSARAATIAIVLLAVLGAAVLMGGMLFGFQSLVRGSIYAVDPETPIDPIAWLPHAEAHAADKQHSFHYGGFDAQGVQSDGTVRIRAPYDTKIIYRFVTTPETNHAPIGAGGEAPVYLLRQILISNPHWDKTQIGPGETSFSWFDGIQKATSETSVTTNNALVVPRPTCTTQQLWGLALDHGFPKDAVMYIMHRASGYRMDIRGTPYRMRVDNDCNVTRVDAPEPNDAAP